MSRSLLHDGRTGAYAKARQAGLSLMGMAIALGIGVLFVGLGIIGYQTYQKNAVHNQVLSDLSVVSSDLEIFRSEHGAYPDGEMLPYNVAQKVNPDTHVLIRGVYTDGVCLYGESERRPEIGMTFQSGALIDDCTGDPVEPDQLIEVGDDRGPVIPDLPDPGEDRIGDAPPPGEPGEGDPEEEGEAPSAPVVTVSGTTTTEATFAWDAVQDSALYRVEYRIDGGIWRVLNPNQTRLLAEVVGVSGQKIDLRVQASNSAGSSGWSNTASATLPFASPDIPVLAVGDVTTSSVQVSWTGGGPRYRVDYRYGSGSWQTLEESTARRSATVEGEPGQRVSVRARSINGNVTSEWSGIVSADLLLEAPPAPVLSASEITSSALTVSWPAVGQGSVTYQVQYRLGAGSWRTYASEQLGLSAIIHGVEGQEISVRARASNSGGTGPWSDVLTETLLFNPPPATVVTAGTPDTDSVPFSWREVGEGDVTYEVQIRRDGGDWEVLEKSTQNASVIVSADSGTRVSARVRASNQAGPGPWSNTATAEVLYPVPPSMTVWVDEEQSNQRQGVFAWDGAGDTPVTYEVQYRVDEGNWLRRATAQTPTSTSITGEWPQTLTVRVRATSSGGVGPWSEPVSYDVLPELPGTPVLSIDEVESTTALLTWEAPEAQGESWFEVQIKDGPDVDYGMVTDETTLYSYLVEGDSGDEVWARVRMVNAAGPGGWSNEVNAVLDFTLPRPVVMVDGEDADGVRFMWHMPEPIPGVAYRVESRIGDGGWSLVEGSTTSTSVTVEGPPKSDVSLRVQATDGEKVSLWSEVVTGQIPAAVPEKPELSVTLDRPGRVSFEWGDDAAADRYDIRTIIGDEEIDGGVTAPTTRHQRWREGEQLMFLVRGVNEDDVAGLWSDLLIFEESAPLAPQSLEVEEFVKGDLTLRLTPAADDGATSYQVRTSTTDGEWTSWREVDVSDTLTDLPDAEVTVQARALNDYGESDHIEVIAEPTVQIPATPRVNAISGQTTTSAVLHWSSVAGATEYHVDRMCGDGDWVRQGTAGSSATSMRAYCEDDPGARMRIRVRASNAAGVSGWASGSTTLMPPAPDLRVSSITSSSVTFSWNRVDAAQDYRTRYRINGGAWSGWTTTTGTSVSVSASQGSEITLEATSHNGITTGSASSITASVGVIPAAPSVSGSSTSPTRAAFSWPSVSGATRYERQERCGSGSWSSTVSTTTRSRNVTCGSGETARIRVRSVGTYGTSSWSTVSVNLPVPSGAPSVSVSGVNTSSVSFSWTQPTGATGYQVRTRINGNSWSAWTNHGTSRSLRVSVGTQGDRVRIQVRGTNARGSGSSSSTVGGYASLSMASTPNGWIVSSGWSNTNINFQLVQRTAPRFCPSGTHIQTQFIDVVEGRTWSDRSWSGWSTKSGTPYWSGNTHRSYTPVYDLRIIHRQNIRCYNPNAASSSSINGYHQHIHSHSMNNIKAR